MRIDQLTLRNFKAFEELTISFGRPAQGPATSNGSFHLMIGENGAGKTAALDGLAVAAGSWFLGIRGYDSRHIQPEDVRLSLQEFGDTIRLERQYPVTVEAIGRVSEKKIVWRRSLLGDGGRTTRQQASRIKNLAEAAGKAVMQGEPHTLPLVSYFGTGRLWQEPKNMAAAIRDVPAKQKRNGAAPQEMAGQTDDEPDFGSRFAGYRFSIDPRCSPRDLLRWLQREKRIAVDEGKESTQFTVVKEAIRNCLESCRYVDFNLRLGTLLVELEGHARLPFGNLSDGQRNMLAMVGDLAFKAAQLNPHLGQKVLEQTPGIVMIDELDLHLHPRWQRHVVGDLCRTFPEIQFIATTHSQLLVSEVQPESLIVLTHDQLGKPAIVKPTQSYGLDANWVLEHILGVPARPEPTIPVIQRIEEALEDGDLNQARTSLAELRCLLHGDDGDVARLEATINNLEALADAPDSEAS